MARLFEMSLFQLDCIMVITSTTGSYIVCTHPQRKCYVTKLVRVQSAKHQHYFAFMLFSKISMHITLALEPCVHISDKFRLSYMVHIDRAMYASNS